VTIFKKILQCLFVWRVKSSRQEELQRADSIIAFSFGDFEPSVRYIDNMSNSELAKIVVEYASSFSIKTAFVQGEIDSALRDKLHYSELGVIFTADSPKKDGGYPSTREVAKWLVEHNMKPYGCRKPIIIAHPNHMWRAKMVCERFVDEVLIADTSSVPYDKWSVQWRTRNKINFVFSEILTRIYFLLRRWI